MLPLWQSSDVTLMQVLLGKGGTRCGNCDSTFSHSIISHYGLTIFAYRNRILTKLCLWKLGGLQIMNYRVLDNDTVMGNVVILR